VSVNKYQPHVYVLPEQTIGLALAKDCRENTNATWGSDLLRHNETELKRLRQHVFPILFARGT
jgi:hypothetical protein